MQQTTHTPGPWRIILAPTQVITDRQIIATVTAATDHSAELANARLIAAAPDLLEALQALIATRVPGAGSKSPEWIAARAAIAKATRS